jgi:hypothetical protein
MQVLDTIATILLFVVLFGWVLLSIYVGANSVTLSDSGAPGIALIGVALAVVGIPLSVVVVYVVAGIRAWHADGYTFYYPLLAFVVGTLAAALVMGVALGVVRLGLRIHGTDEERRRKGKRVDAESSAEGEVRPVAPVETPTTSAPPRVIAYDTTRVHGKEYCFVELGIETASGRRYLRTSMPQRNGEWEEYYGIDVEEYKIFTADAAEARRFADECQDLEHSDRLLPVPGTRAYEPITSDRKNLARKRATLLTDNPTDSSGVLVQGIPAGTAFVRMVDNSVDPDGNVQVRLLGVDTPVVSIAADQLGL